jgi:hypothetical protein
MIQLCYEIEEDCYWFSLADSDILFWAQGLNVNLKYDVEITEPDVSPIQFKDQNLKILWSKFLAMKF